MPLNKKNKLNNLERFHEPRDQVLQAYPKCTRCCQQEESLARVCIIMACQKQTILVKISNEGWERKNLGPYIPKNIIAQ